MIGSTTLPYARKRPTRLFSILTRHPNCFRGRVNGGNLKVLMKKLKFLIGFLVTFVFFHTSLFSQEGKEKEGREGLPAWVSVLSARTNVLTSLVANYEGSSALLEARWLTEGNCIRLTCQFAKGGDRVILTSLILSQQGKETACQWTLGGSSSEPFPAGLEKEWIGFAKQLMDGYKVISDDLSVEVAPLKFVERIQRLWDGGISTSYLFWGEKFGKYRLIDEGEWIGEAPKIGQLIYLGSNGARQFAVEKMEERFLLSPKVMDILQRDALEREGVHVRDTTAGKK